MVQTDAVALPNLLDKPGYSAIWVDRNLIPVFLDGRGFAFDFDGCGYQIREGCKWVVVSRPCRCTSLHRESVLNNRVRHNTGRNTS